MDGRRRAARGAAMIESLVVISVMILFFLGMVFFHSMFGQKLRAISLARSATIAHAMNACTGDPLSYVEAQLGDAVSSSVSQSGGNFDPQDVTSPQVGLKGNAPVAEFLKNLNYAVEATTETDVTTKAGAQTRDGMTLVGFEASPRTASFALCGDHEAQGDYKNVVKDVIVKDAFPFSF